MTFTNGWSWSPCPTGESTRTSMPSERRWSAGPTPESMSSCGLFTAPPHRTTSASARASIVSPRAT